MDNNLFSILYESGAAEINSPRIGRKRRAFSTRQKQLIAKRIQEVMHGLRPYFRVYSRKLHASVWFVNEGMINPRAQNFDGTVITMERLADILSAENLLIPSIIN